MAIWRKKACETFGFAPGKHSYARGKIELFADLIELARNSNDDTETLDRIAEYVTWAATQTSEELASAVDLAFFLPMFRDASIQDRFRDRFPAGLLASKMSELTDET